MSRMYSPWAYSLAEQLGEDPFVLIEVLLMVGCYYPLIQLSADPNLVFGYFFLVLFYVQYATNMSLFLISALPSVGAAQLGQALINQVHDRTGPYCRHLIETLTLARADLDCVFGHQHPGAKHPELDAVLVLHCSCAVGQRRPAGVAVQRRPGESRGAPRRPDTQRRRRSSATRRERRC